jgi:hypothetical protein
MSKGILLLKACIRILLETKITKTFFEAEPKLEAI